MRTLTLELPEPPAINRLLRMHHRDRSAMRDALVIRCLAQRPRGWRPLRRWRLDATLRLWNLRDPLELAAGLKLHVDAIVLAGIAAEDSGRHLELGKVEQMIDRAGRGATVLVTERAA